MDLKILTHTRLVKYQRNPEVDQALFASHVRELEQLRRMEHTSRQDDFFGSTDSSNLVVVHELDRGSSDIFGLRVKQNLRTLAPMTMVTFERADAIAPYSGSALLRRPVTVSMLAV